MPQLLSGLEWDAKIEEQLFDRSNNLDVIELIPENFFYAGKVQMMDSLENLRQTKKTNIFSWR